MNVKQSIKVFRLYSFLLYVYFIVLYKLNTKRNPVKIVPELKGRPNSLTKNTSK